MRLRLVVIDEFQFLTCLQRGLWGSKSARFKDWHIGDYLGFIVGKHLAGLAEVAGPTFRSEEQVWDNGLYPYRIPIRFLHVLTPEDRIPVLGPVRDALTSEWGPNYGIGLVSQLALSETVSQLTVGEIRKRHDAMEAYRSDLSTLMQNAKCLWSPRGTGRTR